MTVYNVYHPAGWLMCNMRDAEHATNLPGSGRWGERLPVFIPCGDDGTLSHAEAVAILRRAAEAEAEPLRGMMLKRATAIENYEAAAAHARQPGLW